MSDNTKVQECFIEISAERSKERYAGLILVPTQNQCTNPRLDMVDLRSRKVFSDLEVIEQLSAEIEPANGGTDIQFLEHVQVRRSLLVRDA